MNMNHPDKAQPDPISSHIQFLSRVPEGRVRLSVRLLSLGYRVSVLQVELRRADENKMPSVDSSKTCVLGLLTQGNLATEKGIYLPTTPAIPKAEIPDRETDCIDYLLSDIVIKFAPVVGKVIGRVPPGGSDGNLSYRLGPSIREVWLARKDGIGLDVSYVGRLCDAVSFFSSIVQPDYLTMYQFSGAPGNYTKNNADFLYGIAYPTLSMTTEIKKDPKGAKWIFQKLRTYQIKNGRFDTEVQLFDEEGDLVALSKHVSLVTEGKLASSPNKMEQMRKIFKSPEEIEKLAKL